MRDREFVFKPSKRYCTLNAIFITVNLLIIVCLPLLWWVQVLLLLFVSLYGVSIFWKFGLLRAGDSIAGIYREADGHWLLTTNRDHYVAELKGDSTITNTLSILRFKVAGHRLAKVCVVFPDSLPGDDYRKLIVALRMH